MLVDWWSLGLNFIIGIIIFEMLTGKNPFIKKIIKIQLKTVLK